MFSEKLLSWDDWVYTSTNLIALRHVEESNLAEAELKNGGNGDAYSLVIPGLIPNISSIDDFELVDNDLKKHIDGINRARCTENQIENDYLEKINQLYQSYISATDVTDKKNTLVNLFNLFFKYTVMKCQELGDHHHHYLLIGHPHADNPYDYSARYFLGKCGRGHLYRPALLKIDVHDDDLFGVLREIIKNIRKLRGCSWQETIFNFFDDHKKFVAGGAFVALATTAL